ncbi:hypothetical protein [Mesomycoplasma lagogenitalium]|uniref:Lipoprotein n=1 Tax=Mesomycoplasma lagogenitalium TaxID=171286 RepID=A0ABY8LWZ7_9BACT|nr:hypothetical protein [Mesomycoplasma lagogenitalium]WGI36843.1 hypothetical protein QEG99_00990 [Mesomycoplasma lagogenitalium]
MRKKILKFSLVPIIVVGISPLAISCYEQEKSTNLDEKPNLDKKPKIHWLDSENNKTIIKWKTFLENNEFDNLQNQVFKFSEDLNFLQKVYSVNKELFEEATKSLKFVPIPIPEKAIPFYTAESYKWWMYAQVHSVKAEQKEFKQLFDKYYEVNGDKFKLKDGFDIDNPDVKKDLDRLEYIGITIYDKQIPLIQYHYQQLLKISNDLNKINSQ